MERNDRTREKVKKWASFYRANPHRLVEAWGVQLFIFQKILIYMCFQVDFFMYLASRGQGKSFIVALICIIRCVLYPKTKVVLASGTKGQAKLIVTQKIQDLYNQYPDIRKEIKEIKTATNEVRVIFRNGSTIDVCTSSDNARGYRCNVLVIDECRLVKQEIQDKVLRPFLNVNRQPRYLKNPKYKHLAEENKEIYISSAWYENDYLYQQFNSFKKGMLEGKSYFVCGIPYTISLYHGLLSRKRIEQIKTEEQFDSISFRMEYECLFFGESEKAFYKLDEITPCRTLYKPFIPLNPIKYLDSKGKRKKSLLPRRDGEIRLVGMDIALMQDDKKNSNDNSIITCMRLLPTADGTFRREVCYMESINGSYSGHSERQAIRLREIFEDFEGDYIVMDTNGNGISVYEVLTKTLYNPDRDVEYPAICAFNDEKMSDRAYDKNAIPLIYSIKAVKAETNHEIAMGLKSDFQQGKIKLLVNEIDAKSYLEEKPSYKGLSLEEQIQMLFPYIQTNALINELINLEYRIQGGFIKIYEVGRQRKDRYSSLAYTNYYARILESDIIKKNRKKRKKVASMFQFKVPQTRSY